MISWICFCIFFLLNKKQTYFGIRAADKFLNDTMISHYLIFLPSFCFRKICAVLILVPRNLSRKKSIDSITLPYTYSSLNYIWPIRSMAKSSSQHILLKHCLIWSINCQLCLDPSNCITRDDVKIIFWE